MGRSYFIETPALSGLSIGNYYWNSSLNLTGIIPQWNNSSLLGTSTQRFFEANISYIYYLNMYSISDRNLKTNIKPINGSFVINAIKRINGYTYDYKPEVFPQLVVKDEKTQQLSVNYVSLIPVLIESIKEQQKQIEALQILVQQLQQKMADENK